MDGVNIPRKMCGVTIVALYIPWLLFATGSLSFSWPVTLMIVLQFSCPLETGANKLQRMSE